jgi:hypothetical protein
MNFFSIPRLPSGRCVLSLLISSMIYCPAVLPQGESNSAKPEIPANSVLNPPDGNTSSAKSKSKFTPPVWPPIDVDAAELTLDSQVPCLLPSVLKGASQHAIEFSANLDRFTATEIIQSADAQKYGSWTHFQTNTFDYMAIVTRPRAGVVYVDESRLGKPQATPLRIQTEGLAVTALIFHPQNINEFDMQCEGLSNWRGTPSWRVHFAQKAGKAADFQVIHADGKRFPVKLKGRAWIAADSYEIEHIDVDLLEQIPEIRLFTEHLSIDYGSVKFTNGSSRLWLPEQADFFLELGDHHFFNHHEMSNFVLFSVGVKQDLKEPPQPKQPANVRTTK